MVNMIHLHLHSHYSVLDGLGTVEQIVAKAKEMKTPAVAITDHASISSMPELIKCSAENGIKPIVGCEFYIVDKLDKPGKGEKEVRYHLIVLAKSWRGVQSIMRQLSTANEQFYLRPRLSWEQATLFEDCIIMTACSMGLLTHPDWQQLAGWFYATYQDDFYAEIMPHAIVVSDDSGQRDLQRLVNERAMLLRGQVKPVATIDAHYVAQADAYTHEILLSIQTGKQWDDPKRWRFTGTQFYMMNTEEMVAAFQQNAPYLGFDFIKEALLSTVEIANKIDIQMPEFDVNLPSLYGDDDERTFFKIIAQGWMDKVVSMNPANLADYKARMVYEIEVIKTQGFIRYFLMVEDIIREARSNGIMVGPARGSAAGSLVCFLMGITQVDPIKHGLYFERFLNPERIDLPDIDTDFQDDRRSEVFAYIKNKYGDDYTANINTLGILTMTTAFRDVARTFGIPPLTVNGLSKLIEDEDSFESVPELVRFAKDKEGKNIIEQAKKLKGTIRQQGVHACFSGESRLLTSDGYKTMEKLCGTEFYAMTPNGKRRCTVSENGVNFLYKLPYGKSKYSSQKRHLMLTEDHPVMTTFGFTAASDCSAQGEHLGVWPSCKHDISGILAGWFWNDGYHDEKHNSSWIYFTPKKDDEAQTIISSAFDMSRDNTRKDKYRLLNGAVLKILNRFGDGYNKKTFEKEPPQIESLDDSIPWLCGFMSANATVQKGTIRLKISSLSLIGAVKDMLELAGIGSSKIMPVKGKECNFPNGIYRCKDSFCIEIGRNDSFAFKYLIGFLQTYKNRKIDDRVFGRIKRKMIDKVYDFAIISDDDSDHCGYVDGVLVHNCGFLVSSHPLHDVAVFERRKDATVVNWDMRLCEKFGLLKMDILGLTTLTVLSQAARLIEERHGIKIEFTDIPLDDPKTAKAFAMGDTVGIFQFENSGMRKLLMDLQAETFEMCTDATALYRPGSLESGETLKYVQVAQGNRYEEYLCNELVPILKPTKGVMVYQEQIMQIFVALGGFTWGHADKMRKIIGKKLGADAFNEHRQGFVDGCQKNNIDEGIATVIFDKMVEFAKYSFNRSHAVAYTMLSWWTMWIKQNYPIEFYTADLTHRNEASVALVVRDAEAHGIAVSLPDINLSMEDYTILDDKTILAPLGIIKGLGSKAVEAILEARVAGPFLSRDDLVERVNRRACNVRIQDTLYRAGAFESLGLRERDPEIRQKNYSELVPIFNKLPGLEAGGAKIDMEAVNLLYSEISDCCIQNSKPFVLTPKTGARAPIMVINNPVKGEDENLKNKGTKYFLSVAKEYGLGPSDFYYTSAVKCYHPNQKEISKDCQGKCMEFLKKEIQVVGPKLIVCFASNLISMFASDKKATMGKLNGEISYCKEFDCYVLFSYSPQYAYYQPEVAGEKFVAAISKLSEIFSQSEK